MKRISFYIFIGLAVSLSVAIVCWHRSQNGTVKTEPTNEIAKAPAPTIPSNSPIQLPANESIYGITPEMTETQKIQKWVEWAYREAAKNVPEQKPFAFYGKIVDENQEPVVGASIHFGLRTTTALDGTSNVNTISAEDGEFSLAKGTGSHLHVDVWKANYYTVGSSNQVEFDTTGGSTKDSPVLFYLKKKGEGVDLITSQYGVRSSFDAKMPRDGTPVRVDLLNRRISGDGQIQLSQVKPPYASWKKATAWSFQIEIPDGGFVDQNEEFPFEAPASGYKSKITFDFKASQPDWKTSLKKSYYIVFGNPPRFGRIDFETDIMGGGATITYVINPDGSRNLEPK